MPAETTKPTNIERLLGELSDGSVAKRLVESCTSGAADGDAPNPKAVIEEEYRKHFGQIKNA